MHPQRIRNLSGCFPQPAGVQMKTETESKMDNLVQRIGELAEDSQKRAMEL